jgi:hypothetical protein
MPEPINIQDIPVETPAEHAWKKYKVSQGPSGDTAKDGFMAGWNAALAWIPFRIAQFRELEEMQIAEIESLKKEIEDLKRGRPPIDSGANPS